MDWNNNPRIDIEKRIKQLEKRWRKIYSLRRKLSKYTCALSPRGKVYAELTWRELQAKRKQLKSF